MRVLWLAVLCLIVAGCATRAPVRPIATESVPTHVVANDPAARAAALAAQLVGAPYKYGGATPDGFDCSGLVWYVYQTVGLAVPRTAVEQQAAARPVPLSALRPGDLVFFYTAVDHVGIYLGGGEFVHAPATGRSVTRARLDSPYFLLGFAGAGRLSGS